MTITPSPGGMDAGSLAAPLTLGIEHKHGPRWRDRHRIVAGRGMVLIMDLYTTIGHAHLSVGRSDVIRASKERELSPVLVPNNAPATRHDCRPQDR